MKKILTAILVCAVLTGMMSGCGNEKKTISSAVIDEVTTPDTYPIETDETLTYYVTMDSTLTNVAASMNETEFAKALIEKTGINVEFQHPTIGQETESFNLMIASGEYPDIIEYYWPMYSGGAAKALDTKVILPLNDVISKVSPNLTKIFEENYDLKKNCMADGEVYMYPFYRTSDVLLTYYGTMIRKDLLEKTGLEAPETIDEWETVLRAFKEYTDVPLLQDFTPSALEGSNAFVGAFGVSAGFYVDDGKVKYGPMEDGFKDFVYKIADWYKEGLIDAEFANGNSDRISSLVINGKVGAVSGYNGSSFGTWLAPFREKNPGADMMPVKYAVLNKGERPQFGQKDAPITGTGAAISTQCKNVELAARLLDYGYSEEGQMLYNFGIEGESYEMIDSKPVYTKKISDSENQLGIAMGSALSMYTKASSGGPYAQREEYILQFYRDDVQKEALKVWSDTDALEHKLPNVEIGTKDSQRISKIMGDVKTSVDENVIKLIMGVTPLDQYDSYVQNLKNMGIDEAIEIYQKAYDNYVNS